MEWEPTGEEHVDFEPTEVSDQYSDDLMKSKDTQEKSFMTYVTRTDRDAKEYRVRVNYKFRPKESHVNHLPSMMYYSKTTMGKYEGEPE